VLLDQIRDTIGKTFADHLNREVLAIGRLKISAHALVNEVGCANLVAAQRLSQTLKRLGVKDIRQLARIDPASLYRVQGCGHTQVYVAMCLLEHHVRDFDASKWWGWEVKGEAVLRAARDKTKQGPHELPDDIAAGE
jgi:hypothetical protein